MVKISLGRFDNNAGQNHIVCKGCGSLSKCNWSKLKRTSLCKYDSMQQTTIFDRRDANYWPSGIVQYKRALIYFFCLKWEVELIDNKAA